MSVQGGNYTVHLFSQAKTTVSGAYEAKEEVSWGSSTPTSILVGTGSGQYNQQYVFSETLVSTSRTFDLTALTGSLGAVSFSKVKLLGIWNDSTADGATLLVGGAASNPWYAGLSDTSAAKVPVLAGSFYLTSNWLLQGSNPWTVSGTAKNLKIDSGAATITYRLLILGLS